MRIDVISDFVCPWCFIGMQRLRQALAGGAEGETVSVFWHAFFLNPDTPSAGEPYRDFMERKFGGAEAVDELHRRLIDEGGPDGIQFDFESMQVRPSTIAAHALMDGLQREGFDSVALAEGIFRAHFLDGENIGRHDALIAIARAAGLPDEPVARILAQPVEAEDLDVLARDLGVAGVPLFFFEQRRAVPGAQSVKVLQQTMRACREAPPEA